MAARKHLPAAEIITLYCDAELSSNAIAKRYQCHANSVSTLLRRHGIPMRSHLEAARVGVECGRIVGPWKGKRLSREHRYKIGRRGPQNARWRDGRWYNPWRRLPKTECKQCGATEKLCHTHRNNDRDDWREANRFVLCVTCHRSHRKKQYWRSVRAGEKPMPWNGRVGWTRSEHHATAE